MSAVSAAAPGAIGCARETPHAGPFVLRADDLGYLPGLPRTAVILGGHAAPPRTRLCDLASGAWIGDWTAAGEPVLETHTLRGAALRGWRVDVGAAGPGRYSVVLEGRGALGPVRVGADAWAAVVPAMVTFLRSQRCGGAVEGPLAHPACHRAASVTDGDPATHSGDGVAVRDAHRGPVDVDAGPAVNVEGGWHDAGDYVKFLGTTAFVVAVDLLALRDHPAGLGAERARLATELSWGADWIERMTDSDAPMHQVSGELDHAPPPRRPEADTVNPLRDDDDVPWEQRPAYRIDVAHGRGANVLGRASAALALWSAVVPTVLRDDPTMAALARRRLALARRLDDLARTVERPQPTDPPDFYPEASTLDDLALAAATLATVTGEARYASDARALLERWLSPDNTLAAEPTAYWGDVTAVALAEMVRSARPSTDDAAWARTQLGGLVAPLTSPSTPRGPVARAFGWTLGTFGNGSIAQGLGAALACVLADAAGAASGCRAIAADQVHWTLGRNPFGVTFVAGLGARSPEHPHHDLARVTGIAPFGAVVGGPAELGVRTRSGLASVVVGAPSHAFAAYTTHEAFYEDDPEDYVVNEPAIDFTPALVYVAAALADHSPRGDAAP